MVIFLKIFSSLYNVNRIGWLHLQHNQLRHELVETLGRIRWLWNKNENKYGNGYSLNRKSILGEEMDGGSWLSNVTQVGWAKVWSSSPLSLKAMEDFYLGSWCIWVRRLGLWVVSQEIANLVEKWNSFLILTYFLLWVLCVDHLPSNI